ncbi:hypothetical protein C8R44DRAFT_878949 [Mycena epipterygia]|nr:hypothetical protein C8R44DRAFT_878949 [Mycena epipterygia]
MTHRRTDRPLLSSRDQANEADFPSLRLLLNSSLSWPLPITPSDLSLLPILAHYCPLLATLDLSHSAFAGLPKVDSIHLQRLALSTFTRAQHHLEDVTLEQLDRLAFDHLSRLPTLRSMVLILPTTLEPNIFIAPSTVQPRLPALRNLELQISNLEAAASYFPAFSYCRFDTVRISTNGLAVNTIIAALHAAVSSHVAHDTLDIGGRPSSGHRPLRVLPIPARDGVPQYLVNHHTLRPLFEFFN